MEILMAEYVNYDMIILLGLSMVVSMTCSRVNDVSNSVPNVGDINIQMIWQYHDYNVAWRNVIEMVTCPWCWLLMLFIYMGIYLQEKWLIYVS